MKDYPTIFREFLGLIEMELVRYEDGYGLIDLQGANLGDIEGDRFQNASDLIDRLDIYINDYYIVDLEEEYTEYFDTPDSESPYHTAEEWCEMFKLAAFQTSAAAQFISAHLHEFQLLDMIVNHADDVSLDAVYTLTSGAEEAFSFHVRNQANAIIEKYMQTIANREEKQS